MTTRTKRTAIAAGLVAALGLGGAAVAIGSSDDDATEKPITGPALQRASDAALGHVGEGRVTDTEVGDEEGYYEVEVTRDDGSEVDVHLGRDFGVLGTEDDDDSAEDGS